MRPEVAKLNYHELLEWCADQRCEIARAYCSGRISTTTAQSLREWVDDMYAEWLAAWDSQLIEEGK